MGPVFVFGSVPRMPSIWLTTFVITFFVPNVRMVQYPMSEDWLKARQESSNIHKIVHKFDWTYFPYDYRGTTSRTHNIQQAEPETSKEMGTFRWEPTEERIDYEKLREREPDQDQFIAMI